MLTLGVNLMEPDLRRAAATSQDLWFRYLQAPEGQDRIELDLASAALCLLVQLLVRHLSLIHI